jgi:REP element-mobilizing transposase RayT
MPILVKPLDYADPLTIRQKRLPHWRQDGCAYFVTCHLGDSLPARTLRLWAGARSNWLELHPSPWTDAEALEYHERFTEAMERHLDAGAGGCALGHPGCARAVVDTLTHGNGTEYELGSFVVMPNHMHLLVLPMPGIDLSALTGTWELISARRINRIIGRKGRLWADDAFDHIVRNAQELGRIDAYIRRNPEKAGLRPGAYALGGSTDGWTFLPGRLQ